MTFTAFIFAALAVLPADRLSMADRLFNAGRYDEARGEYELLKGERTLAADDILYRLAECDRALGKSADARREYGELLDKYPTSKHAGPSRLMRALSGSADECRLELKTLDSDATDAPTRAAALYHLGTLAKDPDLLARVVKLDPKGRYAPYADFHRAAILAESSDPAKRREAVASLLAIAFGGSAEFAEDALYLAAVQSYLNREYGEAASLLHRYLKSYPSGKRFADVRDMAAWSDYFAGKFSDALALCGEGKTDDLAYLKAAATSAMGDETQGEKLFRGYLERFPAGRNRENAELALARRNFESAGKAGEAAKLIESAKRAYAISKSSGDGIRLAWAYERDGKADEALALYRDIAAQFGKSADGAEALYRKAMIDLRAERWSAAELALAEALANPAVGSRKASALYWRGVAALRLEHVKEGADFLRNALEAGLSLDESREARLLLADIDLESGKTEAARAAYAKLVSEGACDRMSAAKTLAVGKLVEGDAARTCAKALVANAAAEWRQAGHALLGLVEEKAQSYTAAIAAYRQALAEPVETEAAAEAALALGLLESRAGELVAADATLKRAVTLNKSSPRARALAYLALARTCVARKDFEGARGYATVVANLFDDKELVAEATKILEELK